MLHWYLHNRRDLPWRETRDPYCIWISEVILQQTRVAQGLDYYRRFISRFPTVSTLAEADEQEVLQLWQGLGYYSRARNLHCAARQVVERYEGIFPPDYDSIRSLKGIGDYTAAAIASIAFDLPKAVLDGNVFRVLARLHADPTPIDTTHGHKHFQQLADQFLQQSLSQRTQDGTAGYHNQAIMELGALICTPKQPACNECPLCHNCKAQAQGIAEQLPLKQGKTKVRNRYFNYYLLHDADARIAIHQRQAKDIWQHLYELPLLESDHLFCEQEALETIKKTYAIDCADMRMRINEIKHVLSHQKLHVRLFEAHVQKPVEKWLWVSNTELEDYPTSRLTERLLES